MKRKVENKVMGIENDVKCTCDKCGDVVETEKQYYNVIKFGTHYKDNQSKTLWNYNVKGFYCDECIEKINTFLTKKDETIPENIDSDELARVYNKCKCGGELCVAEWQCMKCNNFIGNP